MDTNTQEQQQETRSIPSVDFSHRLNKFSSDDEVYNAHDLANDIGCMTSRADSVLNCLIDLFQSKRVNEMNDEMLTGVIGTVLNELRDIDALVIGFSAHANNEVKA